MSEITSILPDARRPRQLHLRRLGLEVLTGPSQGSVLHTDRDTVRVGSHTDNDLVVSDPAVSRFHAEISRTPDGLLLRDLDSTNGTWVQQMRVREVYLGDKQAFRIGQTEIRSATEDDVIDIVPAPSTSFENLVGRSVAMREVFSVLERVAPTDLTVLVTGETGTGKELVSRALHARSKRSSGPFVVLDCGAVPSNLMESELFGHERGAFTGAVAARPGVFEQAHGGTLFLDELGELPLALQPKLLRVLEQREVRRVGGTRLTPVDVRVVAATNRDPLAEVEAGRFRRDLYYRLAVVDVTLPPLRARREDLPLLVLHLLENAPLQHRLVGVTSEVNALLEAYHWPGNVRELRNVLMRALPFCDGDLIELSALPEAMRTDSAPPSDDSRTAESFALPSTELSFREARDQLLDAFERAYLQDLLQRTDGNVSRAARLAGVDRKTLNRMLKRCGLR